MRWSVNIIKFLRNVLHYCFTTFLTLIFIVLISLFLFVVAVKVSPKHAEDLTLNMIEKTAKFFNVKHGNIDVKIQGGVVKIDIEHFTKRTAKIVLQGKNAIITASLYKLWQGALYEISINEFTVQLNKLENFDDEASSKKYISSYYALIPSVKMFIKNFKMNLYGNVLLLQDAKLSVNELHYILTVQTHSKQDGYKLNILLDRKDLYIYFNGISSKFLNKYFTTDFNFLNFKALNGKIIVDTHNTNNIQFSCTGEDIELLKGKFVQENLTINHASVLGYVNDGNVFVKFSDISMLNKTKAEISIKIENEITDVDVNVKNATILEVKNLVTDYVLKLSGIEETFQYLKTALNEGVAKTVDVKIHSPVLQQHDVAVSVEFENASFLYNEFFPQIYNGYGTVSVNRDYTTVDVVDGRSGNNFLKNSRAVFNHNTSYLSLNINLEGSPAFLANTFDVKNDYTTFENYFKGNVNLQTFIGINLKCEDVYFCTNINGNAKFSNVLLPFAQKPVSGKIKVTKGHKKPMNVDVFFNNFNHKYFNIKQISAINDLDVTKQLLQIKDVVVKNNEGSKIAKINLIKIPFKNTPTVEMIEIPTINFANNNFAFAFFNQEKKKEIEAVGKVASFPEILDLYKEFKEFYKTNDKKTDAKLEKKHRYNLLFDIKNALFYNNISTPIYVNLLYNSKQKLKSVDVDSSLIEYHYHNFALEKLINDKQNKLFIQSLQNIALAIDKEDLFPSGTVTLLGNYEEDGQLKWKGRVANLKTYLNKFKFSPREFDVNATLFDGVLKFDKIKMHDNNHTIFASGKIFTDELDIDAKVYYTPSRIELLNTVPILNNAISVATLGQNQNGLVSLEFDVYGNIFTPEVKFNKSSPIKSLWKFSFGVLLLPLVLL